MTRLSQLQRQPVIQSSVEPPRVRWRRARAGAFYGGLGGTVFVLVAGTIDALVFRDLPMRIDWMVAGLQWAIIGVGLSVLGALAAWPSDGGLGVVGSAAGLAVLVLGVNLFLGHGTWAASLIVLVFMALPATALCLPITLGLRWLARQHVQARAQPGLARWTGPMQLALIALALGLIPGLFMRMSPRAERAVRAAHALLQNAAADPGPLSELPDYPAHARTKYELSQRESAISTEGFDVSAAFADGYVVTCVVIVYGDQAPYVRACVEGAQMPGLR
jgi:hypothetical protein